jgi:hypothetical protein
MGRTFCSFGPKTKELSDFTQAARPSFVEIKFGSPLSSPLGSKFRAAVYSVSELWVSLVILMDERTVVPGSPFSSSITGDVVVVQVGQK